MNNLPVPFIVIVRLAKEGLRKGLGISLDEWKQWYSFAMTYCFGTEDHLQGARAFAEKRAPVFKGR